MYICIIFRDMAFRGMVIRHGGDGLVVRLDYLGCLFLMIL